jgi:hypothetical protein
MKDAARPFAWGDGGCKRAWPQRTRWGRPHYKSVHAPDQFTGGGQKNRPVMSRACEMKNATETATDAVSTHASSRCFLPGVLTTGRLRRAS